MEGNGEGIMLGLGVRDRGLWLRKLLFREREREREVHRFWRGIIEIVN